MNGAGWAGASGGWRGDSLYADIHELPPGFDSVTPPTATWVALSESPDRASDPVQTPAIASQQGPTL